MFRTLVPFRQPTKISVPCSIYVPLGLNCDAETYVYQQPSRLPVEIDRRVIP